MRASARFSTSPLVLVLSFVLFPALALADPPASVTDALARFEAELGRAAPDAAARSFAGHLFTDASRALAEARDLVRRGRTEIARASLPLLALRVRLVSLAVDAGRQQSMARERERRALTLLEEARVSRAAFEQAVERRIALEQAPPPYVEERGPAAPERSPGTTGAEQ
ncbi:MAG: hypothetical protein HYY06_31110 [Deltaproteobacteria bacterium]|nr:hypothetical protein [Deltaproteobacteria bacterium]